MNVNVICIGKVKEKYINDGIAEFAKRMQAFGKLSIVELKEFGNDFDRELSMKKEAESIILALEKRKGFNVLLDIGGKKFFFRRDVSQNRGDCLKRFQHNKFYNRRFLRSIR